MKRSLLSALLMLLIMATAHGQVSFGHAEQFNNDWLFSLSDDAAAAKPKYDDQGWRRLSLPHDWSIEGEPSQRWASCTGYLPGGVAWYRKHFTVADTPLTLHYIYFEGVYNRSEVYLNGHLLGKRPNGYVSFLYDLTPYLNKRGENVLAVRVDHSRYADSRWYTGSGIYRDVWLVSAPRTHLAQWGTTYRLVRLHEDGSAEVEVDVALSAKDPKDLKDSKDPKGRRTLSVSLTDAEGHEVAATEAEAEERQTLRLTVPKAHLWDLNDPYLYILRVCLREGGRITDETEIAAGLRTLRFTPDQGFFLNGRNTKVKGVCLHHDAGVLGAAVPREVWVRRIGELKRMGANAIRMSHNPQAPVVYDICDRMGMLVMDEGSDEWEYPKRKWVEGWNQGEPAYDGAYDFFEEWIDRDVRDMVRRDRNHPSVFLWSVGNEVDYPNDPYSHPVLDGGNAAISQPMFGGYKADAPRAERIGKIARRIAGVIRSVDTSRPVTGALAGVGMSNETEYPDAIDVVGYNYTEGRYDTDHGLYPRRVIYGSETGVGYDSWRAVRDKAHIFGQFVWTGTDYLGESGRWPSRGLNTGLLDFASLRKPRGWFRAALWSDEPVCYIGTYPMGRTRNGGNGGMRHGENERWRKFLSPEAEDNWPPAMPRRRGGEAVSVREGDTVRVVCYTNAPQARLLLNDSIVGAMKAWDDSTAIIHWDIAYRPGTLRAEGCDEEGRVVSSYEIHPYGEAARLRVSELLPEEADELHQLLVEIVDGEGRRVKSSSAVLACTVSGPAELLGLENCNNADMTNPRPESDSCLRAAHRGRLVCYVRRTGKGTVTVTVACAGLPTCTVDL